MYFVCSSLTWYTKRLAHCEQRDLKALSEKVKWILSEAEDLRSKYPDRAQALDDQRVDIEEAWERLQQKTTSKRSNLTQEEQLQKFQDDYRDLL